MVGQCIWPPAVAGFFLIKYLSPDAVNPWGYLCVLAAYAGIALKLASGTWHFRRAQS